MSTAKVVPIAPIKFTPLQETILVLLVSVDPEPMDGMIIMIKAVRQHPGTGLVDLARAVGGLEAAAFINSFDTDETRWYSLLADGRAYLEERMRQLGGTLDILRTAVRQAVTEAVLEHSNPGGKPC